ncbi:MAG: site-specific DNA-methyltransferase [Candidatus Geothermincolia bacterium]
MADEKKVEIKPAKGRPMLTWVGKRPLRRVTAFPAQHIETFAPDVPAPVREAGPREGGTWTGWPDRYPHGGLLFHGDNKEVLAHLLAEGFRGKVNLVYIDPPFDSGADYMRKVSLRGPKGTAKLDGESYTLGEQIQYTDIWANDNYLQFMYERLLLLKELLAVNGSILLHCDWNVVHMLRCLLDEVFLGQNFVNEIIWQHAVIGAGRGIYRRLPKAHETLLWYVKNDEYCFNDQEKQVRVPYKDRITKNLTKDEKGYYYTRGRTGTDNPWSRDPRYLKTYVDVDKGRLAHDVWDDLLTYRSQGDEYLGFPTQKPEALIARIVALSSNPGDIILDCFAGSGTTAAVAQKLGRRWIACDINKGAIQTTAKRLQGIITEQIEDERTAHPKLKLGGKEEGPPPPAQRSFTVWRVNDYDLALQHNEAVNLACEHVGVTRTRGDAYFDGTRGNNLVKIIPFNHPLTPLDLEEIKRELAARPGEERDVLVVCLGKETAADAWVEEWNRLRKRGSVPNRIEVIELRTDPRYGKFFTHQPARAKVTVKHAKDRLTVTVEDFISPTVIERLQSQAGLLKPRVDDWRAMVDCIMIDAAWDGSVFIVALSDVPEKKTDLVAGSYDLPAPKGKTTVAVKIIDVLGEEILVTASV